MNERRKVLYENLINYIEDMKRSDKIVERGVSIFYY